MTDESERERFAGELMRTVRDPAIEAADRLATGTMKAPIGARWCELVVDEST